MLNEDVRQWCIWETNKEKAMSKDFSYIIEPWVTYSPTSAGSVAFKGFCIKKDPAPNFTS